MIAAYDIGTTVLKGALLTEEGRFAALKKRQLQMVDTGGNGRYEADPAQWQLAFRSITDEMLAEAGIAGIPGSLKAVVISGNGPTLVPVSADGMFLKPVMSWMDRRGTEQSARIHDVAGHYIDPTFYLPKALWLADNRPDIYDNTAYFLSCPESLLYWLCGEAVTVLPGDHFLQYFWDEALLESLGLDREKFPEFTKPGRIAGTVSRTGAEMSGLPSGLPIITAGADFVVSLLGSGAVYPGRACDRAGTSEGINLCTELRIDDPRLMWYGHVVEPWFNISGIISTSGRSFDWIRDITGCGDMSSSDLDAAAGTVEPGAGSLLFLPYLTGERAPLWDPDARGAFIGLGLNHTREHMVRAVLEATGFAMRDVIEVIAEHGDGGRIEELRITGGPSRSDVWNQVKADITGKNILVPESAESELLGDLVLALTALDDSRTLAETADNIARIRTVIEPRPEFSEMYTDMFYLYRESYSKLKDLYGSLARLQRKEEL